MKNHKIESFDSLKTELDLAEYCKRNALIKQEPISVPFLPTILEIYSNSNASEQSTTIIVDINGHLIAYNNGQKENI